LLGQNESNVKKNSRNPRAALAALALLALLSSVGCESSCPEPAGKWSTREGQSIFFQKNGKALWLTRFGSQVDTVPMVFRYDCAKQPVELDLFQFRSGPLVGKTLFGILEWTSDSTFRFNAEAGTDPSLRPKTFESDQTLRFFLERKGVKK
jgi:hypothetical protein